MTISYLSTRKYNITEKSIRYLLVNHRKNDQKSKELMSIEINEFLKTINS